MKRITIKEMRLTNFKGVRNLAIPFNSCVTNIYGRNGSGKTTIFDAFTWLLFGKDSQDRKDFDLKTLDERGRVIMQIPHEVSAVIDVDGTEVRLARRFTEKWVKRAGEIDKQFTGNQEERFFNDVPCTKEEYNAKIAAICDETTFKFITSPTSFTSQKPEVQKTALHRMAGNVSDEEVAAGNPDFEALLNTLSGKTLADFKKEVNAKKSRVNKELLGIPFSIEEQQRIVAMQQERLADCDLDALHKQMSQLCTSRNAIETQIDSVAARYTALRQQNEQRDKRIGELQQRLAKRNYDLMENARRAMYAAQAKRASIVNRINDCKRIIALSNQTIVNAQREIALCEQTRGRLLNEWRTLTGQRKAIRAEQLTIDETQFVCPTCHRPLEVADIDLRAAELQKNFEEQRGQRLATIATRIDDNERDGKANNERKRHFESQIEAANVTIERMKHEIALCEQNEDYTRVILEPDEDLLVGNDAEIIALMHEMEELTKEDAPHIEQYNDESLRQKRDELNARIAELTTKIAACESAGALIKESRQRIADLEKRMLSLNVELADLERQEYVAAEFSKARSEAIEARINGMFSLVKFRWTKTQINGAEKETCEATVDGVPYASLNHAGQINAGLDIINAICRSEGLCAPIFIDNAESLNAILQVQSQIINLIVSNDERIRVES